MNSFPLRRATSESHSLKALARAIHAPEPGIDVQITGIAPLAQATDQQLGFLAHRRYLADLEGSAAGALLVSRELEDKLPPDAPPSLVADDTHGALRTLLELLHPENPDAPEIHSTAVLGQGVQLGRDVRIGPYAVIESGAEIGDHVTIGAHVVVGAGCRLGRDTLVHPHCVLYPGTVLGERVILHAGARVGVDGFGYVFQGGGHRKVPQVGGCVIEDDVEIGANTTIDRGSIGVTRVGVGTKIDNLVHLGHNVEVGPHSVLAGQVGISGSTRIGAGVMAGGQAGIGGHLTVGTGAKLAGQAGIIGDVPPNQTMMGFPARPRTEFLRTVAAQGRITDLLARVRRLESNLAQGPDDPEAKPGE